jgi:dephospho-CoA kinase
MAKRLGITGGIGSGKTTVCRIFRVLGVPVFVADLAAKDLMENDPVIRSRVNFIAGKDLYATGKLDRKGLAGLIFNSPEMLHRVNEVVHPAVLDEFDKWANNAEEPYVIMESAILFEAGADDLVDRILTLSAPVEERIARVMGRNDLSREQVLERIGNQLEDEEREERSYYVISNADNEMILPDILKIHNEMLHFAGSGK